jgi:hypothetical protein
LTDISERGADSGLLAVVTDAGDTLVKVGDEEAAMGMDGQIPETGLLTDQSAVRTWTTCG